jgi:hypothetical protein
VSYTGNATAGATVGHGLGVAPDLVIFKNRSAVQNWLVQGNAIGDTTAGNFLLLESTAAKASNGTVNTTLGASTITLDTSATYNGNGNNHVAYCWSEVEGYSKFGSYTGNGSADGTFVYTGFRPAFTLLKRINAAASWMMQDSVRSPFNVVATRISADINIVEATSDAAAGYRIDYLSNGFKIRNTNTNWNASGGTYIYMAFAETPFKYANAR